MNTTAGDASMNPDSCSQQMNRRWEAAEWFVAMQAPTDLSAERIQDWLHWLDRSPDNLLAFDDVARIWHGAIPAVPRHEPDDDGYDGTVSVAEWRAHRGHRGYRSSRRGSYWRRAVAAAAAMALIGAVCVGVLEKPGPPASAAVFATRTGETLAILLADGSRVELGARSQLSVDFKPQRREVRLDAGEAFFSVHKDAHRPFIVSARNSTITAVGTAFDVRSVADRTTVTVAEGTVSIAAAPLSGSPGSAGDRHAVRVTGGHQLSYVSAGTQAALSALAVKDVDPSEATRWQQGWLVYRDEPLKYVIADISRYTDLRLIVAESAANLRFSGALPENNVVEWILALSQVSPVIVENDARHATITIRATGAGGVGPGVGGGR